MSEQNSNIEILIQRDRIVGESRMIPEGMDVAAITPDLAQKVIHQVELWCKEKKLSRRDVGRAIGYSAPVISEVLGGKYAADWRPIVKDLDAWLDGEFKRAKAPTTTQFVWTSVADEIRTVAGLVCQLKTIGLVYGPETAGIGKTLALQAIHAGMPGSIFMTVDKVHANPTGLLRAIARAMQINDARANRALYDRIVGILKDTPRLLIVDQIHNLRFAKQDRPLYILADIHDRTNHAPQLWAGTSDMVDYLRRGQARGDEPLAQIRSRINYVRDLMQRTAEPAKGGRGEPLYTIQDIRDMFAKNKVKITADGIRFLWDLACLPDSGALRACRNIVRIATIIAEHTAAGSIDANRLRAAMRDSIGCSGYERMASRMSERSEVIVNAG